MDLKKITLQLAEASENYAKVMTDLLPLEIEYQEKLDSAILKAPGASQEMRSARANQIMRVDHKDLFEKYNIARLEAKLAYHKVEVLKIISSNIKSIAYEGGDINGR